MDSDYKTLLELNTQLMCSILRADRYISPDQMQERLEDANKAIHTVTTKQLMEDATEGKE